MLTDMTDLKAGQFELLPSGMEFIAKFLCYALKTLIPYSRAQKLEKYAGPRKKKVEKWTQKVENYTLKIEKLAQKVAQKNRSNSTREDPETRQVDLECRNVHP